MPDPRRHLLDDGTPPPVSTGPGKPLIVLTCGGVIAALLLIVVLNIDTGDGRRDSAALDDAEDVIELIGPPRGLTQDDFRGDDPIGPGFALLAERGWIQTQARDGRPAQRYRCESLDPAPEGLGAGWLRMTEPRIEIFSDRRIITIAGETAVAYAPQRAIEQGTIEGDVVVRVFDVRDGEQPDVDRDEPSMVMRTDKASYENFLGEIRCDDWVRIETPTLTVPGSGLSVLVDDQNDEVRVSMAQFDYATIKREEREGRDAHDPHATSRTLPTSASHEPAPQPDATFYVLTIHDNVRIDEGDLHSRRTAIGDRLEVVFSSRSRGFGSTLADATPQHFNSNGSQPMHFSRATRTIPLHASLAGLLVAADASLTAPQPNSVPDLERMLSPGVTLVRADGPLTIEPVGSREVRLPTAEGAQLQLIGSPARYFDFAGGSEMATATLIYHTDDGSLDLRGDGWMSRRDRRDADWYAFASADMTNQPPRPEPRRMQRPRPDETPELHITWEDGVDLQFDDSEGEGNGRLRSAKFKGKVRVVSNELTLDASEMHVGFPAEGGAESIEWIHATGDVRVEGVVERASIQCDELALTLVQTANGRTIPKLMIATGGVAALDEEQAIWAELLTVTFRELTQALEDDDRVAGRTRDVEVESLTAERDVQVLLAGGTRAFADRLEGDGINERVELFGDTQDVMIVDDRAIVDQGRRIMLDRTNGIGEMPGPGEFRLYQNPVTMEEDVREADDAHLRVRRPVVDENENPIEVRARWRESMVYDTKARDGAGSVDLKGNVAVVADPTPLDHNTMVGDGLTLEFAFVETSKRPPVQTTTEGHSPPSTQHSLLASQSRELARLTARGDAKLESHQWEDASREGEMRIFYVAGETVDYNALTGEADVEAGESGGALLIHDPTPAEESGDDAPFGAKGSTMLTWDGRLLLTRRIEETFDLRADRNVRLRHQNLAGVISTLTADELHATALRAAAERRGSFDFGGSARLDRVRGAGDAEVRTNRRTINCGSFDYDVREGIAKLSAEPPREVTIATEGSPFPMHAQEAVWNMERDTIQITRARGGFRQ